MHITYHCALRIKWQVRLTTAVKLLVRGIPPKQQAALFYRYLCPDEGVLHNNSMLHFWYLREGYILQMLSFKTTYGTISHKKDQSHRQMIRNLKRFLLRRDNHKEENS